MSARRYAILAPGVFGTRSAKTAHGVIAYANDRTLVVIDPEHAGKDVSDVVAHLERRIPIVASIDEALRFGPSALLVGVAPSGGALPPEWRAAILRAIDCGLEIVSGLHQFLSDDTEFARAAFFSGARLWDVRRPPLPRIFDGAAYDVAARVVLTVGTDAAAGKMTTSLELVRAATDAGVRAKFVATGQTGIMIAGAGTAIDRVVADFASGAVEELVIANGDADLMVVEGQGGINHPAFGAVTLALVYGAAPDALVLVHRAGSTTIDGLGTPLLSIPAAIASYEALLAGVKPARVAGVALNTQAIETDDAARSAIETVRAQTGLPCDDVVRFGPAALYAAMAPAFAHKSRPLTG